MRSSGSIGLLAGGMARATAAMTTIGNSVAGLRKPYDRWRAVELGSAAIVAGAATRQRRRQMEVDQLRGVAPRRSDVPWNMIAPWL